MVTAAFVGNEGVHLMTPDQSEPDFPIPISRSASKLLSVVSNPFYGVITDPSSTLSLRRCSWANCCGPFPQYLNVKAVNVGAGHSSYDAGQLTVERRFSQGLAVLFAYTHSKAIDNVGEMTSVAGSQTGSRTITASVAIARCPTRISRTRSAWRSALRASRWAGKTVPESRSCFASFGRLGARGVLHLRRRPARDCHVAE